MFSLVELCLFHVVHAILGGPEVERLNPLLGRDLLKKKKYTCTLLSLLVEVNSDMDNEK